MRLLLIEDSRRLQRSLVAGLQQAGHVVDSAVDGAVGLKLATAHDYAVIILDLMLPTIDGLTLLRTLRESGSETAVLVLTARDTLSDKLESFGLGADDYLVKPFAVDELLARVNALGRRQRGARNPRIKVGDLIVDIAARQVWRETVELNLPAREFGVIELLAQRAGRVVSRTDIEAHLYDGREEPLSNAVEAAIYALRRRLAEAGATTLIETRRGLGYILRAVEA